MPLLGAHESVAGGLEKSFARILQVGGESLQIFTRNQRQWKAAPIREEEAAAFEQAWQDAGNMPIASHASYLINLASGKAEQAAKSVTAFADELQRCGRLGITYAVFHPGSHGGDGVETGLANVTRNLDQVIEQAGDAGGKVTVLLETTAGQGTALGYRFEELATVLENSQYSDRLGVCVDTCHIFAAGYDIRTRETYARTFAEFDRLIGVERICFFHLNDSKKELGSRVDRHEHIGKGHIGLEGFRQLVTDPRFFNHPMTLETPKGKELLEDRENLEILRALY
ncbi:MAG: deoxyribonuclease IV [Desulfobulbus sp.]|nr:MAG: deoxyribonuclease IV [Desulfobulbus sp.]RUM40390.1 MAG: deoxyribonuclease IV [Desulfobulbus sp.]